MSLADAHVLGAWFVVLSNAAVGCWALLAHVRPRLSGSVLWYATAVAEVSIFVQVGLGVALAEDFEESSLRFHMFYGFVAIAVVGILYSYRHQLAGRVHLLYGFGGLFLMGLGIRAMVLG